MPPNVVEVAGYGTWDITNQHFAKGEAGKPVIHAVMTSKHYHGTPIVVEWNVRLKRWVDTWTGEIYGLPPDDDRPLLEKDPHTTLCINGCR